MRDIGLLESAIARQHVAPFGHEQYPTLDLKVAALCDSIARSHPLIDGNKRLSFIAARLTYYLNGRAQLTRTKEELHHLFLVIADAHYEVTELAEIFAETFVTANESQ